ncbi:MAG: hypothetical protein AAFZ65_02800, partial [Planctomycetota bacterium]
VEELRSACGDADSNLERLRGVGGATVEGLEVEGAAGDQRTPIAGLTDELMELAGGPEEFRALDRLLEDLRRAPWS